MDIRETIKTLCMECGPSGFEGKVAIKAHELLKHLCDETWIDKSGNCIGLKRCGKENAKKILLVAHLDEIGLICTGIEEGMLRFSSIGGVDPRMLPNRELLVLTEPPLFGVVSALPPHVLTEEDKSRAISMQDMRIDIGYGQEDAEKLVPIGTPISFRKDCYSLGDNLYCGTSLDDRSCFAACLRALELLEDRKLDCDVYIMGSSVEETNSMGAVTGGFAINPDYCIVIDVTHAETVDGGPVNRPSKLGKGPEISIGPNVQTAISDHTIELAKKKRIPYQFAPTGGNTHTDAWPMQLSRQGFNMSLISLPMRYMHTPIEVIDIRDVEWTAELLAEMVAQPCKEVFECSSF